MNFLDFLTMEIARKISNYFSDKIENSVKQAKQKSEKVKLLIKEAEHSCKNIEKLEEICDQLESYGKYDIAIRYREYILQQDYYRPENLRKLGSLYFKKVNKDYDNPLKWFKDETHLLNKGLKLLEASAKMSSNNPIVIWNLAEAYALCDKISDAFRLLRNIIENWEGYYENSLRNFEDRIKFLFVKCALKQNFRLSRDYIKKYRLEEYEEYIEKYILG